MDRRHERRGEKRGETNIAVHAFDDDRVDDRTTEA